MQTRAPQQIARRSEFLVSGWYLCAGKVDVKVMCKRFAIILRPISR